MQCDESRKQSPVVAKEGRPYTGVRTSEGQQM